MQQCLDIARVVIEKEVRLSECSALLGPLYNRRQAAILLLLGHLQERESEGEASRRKG
jgi:hypothetical protein